MKIRISWWWILFLPMMIIAHMGKTLFFLFVMLSIHECAHIIVARIFDYPISSITVYPFGLCAQIHYIGMGNIGKELLIIGAGPFTHFWFPFLFALLAHLQVISMAYMDYLCQINTSILIFNLLPVFPLDGGRIVQALYHLVFRYTTAQRLTYLTSIINLALLFYYRILTTFSAWLVMGFLLLQIMMCWKQLAYERLAFYHYRKLHPCHAHLRANKKTDLYRAFTNVIKTKQGWILEDEWLRSCFDEPIIETPVHIVL